MGKKILVIEDDSFLRELLTEKLRLEGYTPVSAVDGEEGLQKTREERPDLILLDIMMPKLDGFEVLSQLKGSEELAAIPIIVLSNLGEEEDAERCLKLGAAAYLIKAHHTPGEIIEKIAEIIK